MSISTDELVQRNARFAASGASVGLPFPTNQTLRVIGCVDSRVDPSHVLGLELGEAVVMRNIGGRGPPGAPRSRGVLAQPRPAARGGPAPGGPPPTRVPHPTHRGVREWAP